MRREIPLAITFLIGMFMLVDFFVPHYTVSAAEEVVKQAHAEVGQPDTYNPDNIRYLSDAQFAFAGP